MSEHLCRCGNLAGDNHFDRTICPEPCGMMHTRCNACGKPLGESCPHELDPTWRPDRDEYLISLAQVVSTRATCSRLKVGAVLVRDGRVLTTGYNGAPVGQIHCQHGVSDVETGRRCQASVHAESNAIAFAARHGVATEGAELVVTHAPCLGCSGLLLNAGIRSVLYAADYGDQGGVDRLAAAGVGVRRWER